jgi:hypothetical protein
MAFRKSAAIIDFDQRRSADTPLRKCKFHSRMAYLSRLGITMIPSFLVAV